MCSLAAARIRKLESNAAASLFSLRCPRGVRQRSCDFSLARPVCASLVLSHGCRAKSQPVTGSCVIVRQDNCPSTQNWFPRRPTIVTQPPSFFHYSIDCCLFYLNCFFKWFSARENRTRTMRSISLSWFAYKVIKVDCLRLDDADKHWKITHCLRVQERALLFFLKNLSRQDEGSKLYWLFTH